MQVINDVKMAAYFLNVITLENIKNKSEFFKQLQKKLIELDEKVLKYG